MGKSLYDSISAITDDFNKNADAAKSMIDNDRSKQQQNNCTKLVMDINAMSRDFGERFPDLLNSQVAIARTDHNMGNHDFLKKLQQEFNDNTKDNISVSLGRDMDPKGNGYAADFHLGPKNDPKHGHTLSITSGRGMFYDNVPLDDYVHHLAQRSDEGRLGDVLKLTGAAHNYADFAENAVKTRANEIEAHNKNIIEATKSAGDNMEKVQEALDASKADYNVSFYGRS